MRAFDVSKQARTAMWLIAAGLVVVTASHLAVELFPTQWGGPNIGGGLIVLLGYGTFVAGLIKLVIAFRK